MVRKRSRTSRKYYESDENDSDSDLEFDLNEPAEPAQKKYSLRQRKRPLFTEDFDYDDDEEEVVPPPSNRSDDADFEVDTELALEEAPNSEYITKSTYINAFEPDDEGLQEDPDALIDFEDMIRADIVVNKNRIDYDNIIQKTEIKVQETDGVNPPPVVEGKRGRKPKKRPEGEIDSTLLEPDLEVQEEEDDQADEDYIPEEDHIPEEDLELESDPVNCLQAEFSTEDNKPSITKKSDEQILGCTELSEINCGQVETSTTLTESPILTKPDPVIEAEESCVASTIDPGKTSNNPNQINGNVTHIEPPESSLHVVEAIDDDDVVLVEDEKKAEVIVLDD